MLEWHPSWVGSGGVRGSGGSRVRRGEGKGEEEEGGRTRVLLIKDSSPSPSSSSFVSPSIGANWVGLDIRLLLGWSSCPKPLAPRRLCSDTDLQSQLGPNTPPAQHDAALFTRPNTPRPIELLRYTHDKDRNTPRVPGFSRQHGRILPLGFLTYRTSSTAVNDQKKKEGESSVRTGLFWRDREAGVLRLQRVALSWSPASKSEGGKDSEHRV